MICEFIKSLPDIPDWIAAIAAVAGVLVSVVSLSRFVRIQQGSVQVSLYNQLQADFAEILRMKEKQNEGAVRDRRGTKREAATAQYLNTYEVLCRMYLSRTINRNDFRHLYKSGLKYLFENFHKELTEDGSHYENIRKVYAKLYGKNLFQKMIMGGAK